MAIRIVRNEAGNCINFYGATNPTYWNACLSGEVDSTETDSVNIINDIITSQTGETQYEFFRIPYTEFTDAEGNGFADAQTTADYITEKANVVGLGGGGTDLTGIVVCFKLDDTSTSVMLDNGYSYGVNTIKAVDTGDGLITLQSQLGDITHFTKLDHTNVCDGDGVSVSGGLNDVINYLNELFTVGAFESVVISDPYSTMIADVGGVDAGYTLEGSTAIDPIGDDIFTNSGSGNYAGLLSTATIDQAGEYFTFDIRGEGQIGFGLVHTQASYDAGKYSGSATYADPTTFAVSNSAHYGFQFSHWFHPTPNGSWTNYGANTSYSTREHWSTNWDKKQDWLDGENVKVRVGIDTNGFISIETPNDDGTWGVHARTSYPVAQGAEFHLGIKSANSSARVSSAPKVHLLEPTAPTMNFRYIESPDGNFEYPLFATEEEANYYDSENGGSGTSHTHTYTDDPTNTTWYMPDTNGVENGTSAPSFDLSLGQSATYTEITSLTNSDLAPPLFSANNITQEEGTSVNIQINPAGSNWSTSVSISPSGSGLVWDGYSMVQGTLTDVGADTTYTITVTRGNSYGSTTGTMTVTATDVAPVQTNDTSWTKAIDFSGSEYAVQVSNSLFDQPLQMAGLANTVAGHATQGYTSGNASSRPWATVVVFKSDGYSGNQMIWNQGEGSASGNDNIFVNVTANGTVNFGWGREGVGYNQCQILTNISSSTWYAVYIAHSGERLSGNNASASNLADCFDIRTMSSADSFASLSSNLSITTNWVVTGYRMDRTVAGDFTVGGRGTGYSYRGKIASMVVHCLEANKAMQDATEIKLMITDPVKWEADYLIGNLYRRPFYSNSSTNYQKDTSEGFRNNQMWLMGDTSTDSFPNIRNNQRPVFYSYTSMDMISMVSNDIETVNINGLT